MIGVTEPAANTSELSAARPGLQSASGSAALRRAMIDGQLRVSGVNDPAVLEPMDALPREAFVPAERRAAAYTDRGVPLGHGRTLPPPLTHGQMLVEARPTAEDNVLLIGGGTGYLAALVAPRVASLTVVECSEELAQAAPAKPGRWILGPLAEGAPDGAPYSLILIDGAIERLPRAIVEQLADGGRVVAGLIEHGLTRLAVGRKAAGRVGFLTVADAAFSPLDEFLAPRGWSF
jgi:protein-L-isoaspartate(D-aspartate) O-methyltransferase